MEKSEPALIPEWLKSNGSVSGSSSSNQHCSLASSHSDDRNNRLRTRSKYSFSTSGYDSPRSVLWDSPYFNKKSAGNGSVMHAKNPYRRPYSSFGRIHCDKEDWDDGDLFDFGNKERWFSSDRKDRDSTPFGVSANSFTNRMDNTLRRTQSMISGKQDEWSRRTATRVVRNNNDISDAGGIVTGIVQKTASTKDFPSLGAEEIPGTPGIARTSSLSSRSSVESFPGSASSVIGLDGCNSALAEVPVVAGTDNVVNSSIQQYGLARLSTVASSTTNGLSMAETLAQAPSRPNSAPQISVETQRLSELAIKQSKQLIPVTPWLPKSSVLKSENPKLKTVSKSEMNTASKSLHHQPSAHLVTHTLRGGPVRSDTANSCHVGKLHILKPAQERNCVSSSYKGSPTNSGRVANNPPVVSPSFTISSKANHTATEQKASSHPAIYAAFTEKRSTASQAQSRNDFFKLMRKKGSVNLSSAPADLNHSTLKKSDTTGVTSSDSSCDGLSSGSEAKVASKIDAIGESQTNTHNKEKCSTPFETFDPDEEERRLLCSLGWDENAGEVEGLTEEEISAFYKEYIPVKPSLKVNYESWRLKSLSL